MLLSTESVSVRDRYTEEQIRSFYESGFWQRSSLYDLVSDCARQRPDKTFVFDSTTSLTYEQLRDKALRLAVGLRRVGVRRGDRVAVQLPNWSEFVLLAVALSRAGAILVPIMPIYRDKDVSYVLQHSGATVAITCGEFKGFDFLDMYAGLQGDCPDLTTLIAVRRPAADPAIASTLEALFVDSDPAALAAELGGDTDPDEPFLIVYTSGTTSQPKGCYHTVNTIRSSAAAIAKSLDYSENDVQFGPSPITHSTGLVTSVLLPMLAGASSHLLEAWDPAEAISRIQQHGCTATVTATAFLQMLMGAYDASRHDLSAFRIWVCAGSPIPGAVVQRAGEMLTGGRVLSLYGRSENFLTTMCTVHDAPERSVNSDGSALEGAQVKIVDPAGQEVDRGTEGDITYRGPSHMLGYYRDPEQTADLFTPEGFSRSGDLGVMDQDGYVRVTGRTKDIVIRGGMNISARGLEDLIVGHPSVAAVAVVGMPDERLGEKVCAYIVPAAGQRTPALADIVELLLEKKVAIPTLPERLEVIEQLPMTATGKVQKHLLREDIARKLA